MSKSNVLADNPLDYLLGDPEASAANPGQSLSGSSVGVETRKPREVPDISSPDPEPKPATSLDEEASPVVAGPTAPSRRRSPRRKAASAPSEPPPRSTHSVPNRIGTIKVPYTRSDGVKTRQASVTLPVELLKRVNHYAVDAGMKTNQLYREAIEHYLDSRGH